MDQGSAQYYLQVVKTGEAPAWPRPEEELIVGQQDISDGYTQHWAYPKESGKSAQDLPEAEGLADKISADRPVLLIDQPGLSNGDGEGFLDLIVVKDGHAWGRTQSSMQNLEDNIAASLDFAKRKFNINIEHFMST